MNSEVAEKRWWKSGSANMYASRCGGCRRGQRGQPTTVRTDEDEDWGLSMTTLSVMWWTRRCRVGGGDGIVRWPRRWRPTRRKVDRGSGRLSYWLMDFWRLDGLYIRRREQGGERLPHITHIKRYFKDTLIATILQNAFPYTYSCSNTRCVSTHLATNISASDCSLSTN